MSKERWTVVYAGFRFQPRKGDRSHVYYRIEPGQNHAASGRELAFKKQLLPASPGAILEIDVEIGEDGSVSAYGSGRHYAHTTLRDQEPEQVAMWAAEDRAHSALALAARGALRDDFEIALKPIQAAYIMLGPAQRAQLIAQVVRFISATRGAA